MQTKVQPNPRDQHVPTALYRLYGADGTLLYIGVTDNPDRRFKQHRDTKPWWPQVAQKTIEWRPSRVVALADEADAIRAEAPVYNIDHNPAALTYHWPPAGMPADCVEGIEREAAKVPADQAEGLRRAAWEGFTRTQLAALARECERRGLDLQAVDTTDDGLAHIKDIDGRPTLLVPPTDDLADTLTDLQLIGHCFDCHTKQDDTTTPYYPGYQHIDGSPLMICQPCRDKRAKTASDPNRHAVSHCMDAIEAAFRASENTEMTRKALREFIDRTAGQTTPLTPAQSTFTVDTGLGAHLTTPVETQLRDIDDNYRDAENQQIPFLAAKVVVFDDKPQAYGHHTQVWIDYGRTTGSVTPDKARQVLDAMRGFCDQLEAVVVLAEESAAGDFDGDPEIARLDMEAEDRRIKAINEARA